MDELSRPIRPDNGINDQDVNAMMEFVRANLHGQPYSPSAEYNAWRKKGSARWGHTLRVLVTAKDIARAENADIQIVTVAAIFHDVAKLQADQNDHARAGAEIAAGYLERVGFSAPWIGRVSRVIGNHPQSSPGPFGLEDKTLRDADLLDETGALGIMWTIINAGRQENPSYANAAAKIVNRDRRNAVRVLEKMQTPTGRTLAEQRLAFVENYIAQLQSEYQGLSDDE